MTKSYQIKTYLVDCKGYSWDELNGYSLQNLLDLIKDDIANCAKFLEVPKSYLK